MFTVADARRLTGLTSSEIDRWRARGWWIARWDGGFTEADIIAIACFGRLLACGEIPSMAEVASRASSWLRRPDRAFFNGRKLSGIVSRMKRRARALDRAERGLEPWAA